MRIFLLSGRFRPFPDFEEKPAGKLRIGIVGGGLTTSTEMLRLENVFKGMKLVIGYGQTECAPVISVQVPETPVERRATSVGFPLPGLDARIWREGTGFLKQGEIGEVVVKGPNLMNGSLDLPREAQPFEADGWLHTGDLGLIAEDGLLQLAGRIKDIIIRSGERISPYVAGQWLDLGSMTRAMDSAEDGDGLLNEAVTTKIDEFVAQLMNVESLDDVLSLLLCRIEAGTLNELPATGLEEMQPQELGAGETLDDGVAAEPRLSRPKLDETQLAA